MSAGRNTSTKLKSYKSNNLIPPSMKANKTLGNSKLKISVKKRDSNSPVKDDQNPTSLSQNIQKIK